MSNALEITQGYSGNSGKSMLSSILNWITMISLEEIKKCAGKKTKIKPKTKYKGYLHRYTRFSLLSTREKR